MKIDLDHGDDEVIELVKSKDDFWKWRVFLPIIIIPVASGVYKKSLPGIGYEIVTNDFIVISKESIKSNTPSSIIVDAVIDYSTVIVHAGINDDTTWFHGVFIADEIVTILMNCVLFDDG